MNCTPRSLTLRRPGMTLIEIMVVIAIIAILAGLAAVGVVAMIGNRQARNTEATIRVVNKVLQNHWRYVIDEAKKDTPNDYPAIQNLALPDPTGERTRVLLIKFRLLEAFPQSYAEIGSTLTANTPATTPWVYTNDLYGNGPFIPPGQQRYLASYQKQIANRLVANTNPLTESGACLLMALAVARGSNTALSQDTIRYAIADTDGDGVPELTDSFDTPNVLNKQTKALAFFRFAWNNPGLVNPAAAGSQTAKFADPVDPTGSLINPGWYWPANGNRGNYEGFVTAPGSKAFHLVAAAPLPAANQPPAKANYVVPVIVSAGKDGFFGLTLSASNHLLPDMSIMTPGQNNDNIYSFQLGGSN